MASSRSSFDRRAALAGLLDTIAFGPGVVVLGVVFGASAGAAGVGPLAAVVMSAIVWSGSGQLAALPLWLGSPVVLVLSTLALSARFSLMTAAMAPRMAGLPRPLRGLLAYCVTDETFALAITRRQAGLDPSYLVGSWVVLYATWVGGTAIGVLLGGSLPPSLTAPLAAVFPVTFLVLAVLCCTTRPAAAVALLAAGLAVIGRAYLPTGWHVVLAGLIASLCGPVFEGMFDREPSPDGRGWPKAG